MDRGEEVEENDLQLLLCQLNEIINIKVVGDLAQSAPQRIFFTHNPINVHT